MLNPREYQTTRDSLFYGKHITTKLVLLDSRNRKNLQESSAEYTIQLPTPITNVTRMRIIGAQIPNNTFVFNSAINENTTFYLKIDDSVITVKIRDGNYTPQELVDEINKIFQAFDGDYVEEFLRIYFDDTIGRVYFKVNSTFFTSIQIIFDLDSKACTYLKRNLGYYLGFQGIQTITLPPGGISIGNSYIQTYGDNVFILSINDCDTVEYYNKYTNETVKGLGLVQIDVNKNMIVFSEGNILQSSFYYFQTPIDLDILNICIKTLDNKIPDFHGLDTNIILEVEQIHSSRIREVYRSIL